MTMTMKVKMKIINNVDMMSLVRFKLQPLITG